MSRCKKNKNNKRSGKAKGQSREPDNIGWARGTERRQTKQKHNTQLKDEQQ